TWNITASNAAGSGPTSGTTTVSDAMPSGYVLNVVVSDASWNCSGSTSVMLNCTGTQAVNSGGSFPAIQITVAVPGTSPTGVPNVSVTFQAPASGPSGTFGAPCSGTTCVVTSNASGVATAGTLTANGVIGGPYNVAATAGAIGPVNFALTNTPPPPDVTSVIP